MHQDLRKVLKTSRLPSISCECCDWLNTCFMRRRFSSWKTSGCSARATAKALQKFCVVRICKLKGGLPILSDDNSRTEGRSMRSVGAGWVGVFLASDGRTFLHRRTGVPATFERILRRRPLPSPQLQQLLHMGTGVSDTRRRQGATMALAPSIFGSCHWEFVRCLRATRCVRRAAMQTWGTLGGPTL